MINGLREFAGFRLDVDSRVLWSGETLIELPPKAIDVLCVLTERPGEVVSKRDLIDAVWQGAFVEDSNLTHQIYELRKAFKDNGCHEDLIQTVPRRGYRFVGDVSEIFEAGSEITVERHRVTRALIAELPQEIVPNGRSLSPAPSFVKHHALTLAVLCLGLLGAAVVLAMKYAGRDRVSLADIKSIAVLPISAIGGATDESLEMRLTDSLTTKLASLRTLTVRPTSSVLHFTDKQDPLVIGRLLEVDAVLTGRTQVENGQVRLNLQLISVTDGDQIWAAQIDGDSTRMLAFQDAVAGRLLSSLDLTPDQAAVLERQPTTNNEAFEEFTKGRYFWNKRTAEALGLAIASFEKAVRLDPKFAEAYVGLADSHFLLFDYSYDTSDNNVRLASENLDKAISIAPELAEAYVTRGLIQSTNEWNWSGAETSFRKAIELAPQSSNARHRYAMLLAKLGRFDEAEREILEARRLDPTSPSINMNLGAIYLFSERYPQAAAQLWKAIDLDPAFSSPRWYLARCLWMQGDHRRSLDEYAKASRTVGFNASADFIEAHRDADPNEVIRGLIPVWKENLAPREISTHDIAKLYASIGDKTAALDWLERAKSERHPWITFLRVEPEFISLRRDPRFIRLLDEIGLR